MTDLFFAIDRDYRVLFVNRAVLERNERMSDDYAGKNHWDLWPTMRGTVVEESYRVAFSTGVPVRFEYLYEPTGAWIDANVYPYADHLHIYFRDISDRKLAEQELAHRERELRLVLDAIPHIAWALDSKGDVEYINARWKEFTGLGVDRESMRQALHPEDVARVVETMARSRETGLPEGYDVRVRSKVGDYRWLRVRWSPFHDGDGKIIRWIGTSTDVHDEVLMEQALRESEERYRLLAETLELLVQERTSELEAAYREQESFSYSVSHDLRAPLRSIVSSARILDEDYGQNLPGEAKKLLDRQAHAALRLAQLIDDLLELSRIGRREILKTDVDLSAIFASVATVFEPCDGLQFVIEPNMKVLGDPRLLQLLAQNLLENAVKFSPNGGRVAVGQRHDGAYFVSDQGIGFQPEYASKLFQPFQRLHTDEEFPGTGIGLASVKRIVERHGGRVWADGMVEKGATFFFTLA
jgi:PAS domain S-box-containing protein